jgi:hypothetical protein
MIKTSRGHSSALFFPRNSVSEVQPRRLSHNEPQPTDGLMPQSQTNSIPLPPWYAVQTTFTRKPLSEASGLVQNLLPPSNPITRYP